MKCHLMPMKSRNKFKIAGQLVGISSPIFVAWGLGGCFDNRNYVQQMGFPLANKDVVYQHAYQWVEGDTFLVKAKITLPEAQALQNQFKAQKNASSRIGPFDFLQSGDSKWTPRSGKNLWQGSFSKAFQGYDFSCSYTLKPAGTGAAVLYYYASMTYPEVMNEANSPT